MVGAGLLPAAVHKGVIYLLFGRENELNDTPGWADFGGGSKQGLANFYKGLGGELINYSFLQINKLPKFINFFKSS
jgi:hypothetical protein